MKELSILTRTYKVELKDILKVTLPYYRKLFNYTQSEIADFIGVDRTTYGAWEIGKNGVDIITLKRIANQYGVLLNDLLSVPPKDSKKIIKTQKNKNLVRQIDVEILNITLQYYRKLFKKTQDEIAQFLEIHRTIYCNWERGKNTPNAYLLKKLADYYDIIVDDFFDLSYDALIWYKRKEHLESNELKVKKTMMYALPACRKCYKLTIKQAADEIGVPAKIYEAWENGAIIPDAWTVMQLANRYGFDTETFLTIPEDEYMNLGVME